MDFHRFLILEPSTCGGPYKKDLPHDPSKKTHTPIWPPQQLLGIVLLKHIKISFFHVLD